MERIKFNGKNKHIFQEPKVVNNSTTRISDAINIVFLFYIEYTGFSAVTLAISNEIYSMVTRTLTTK